MISLMAGKDIAGRAFVEKFGKDFVRTNIDKLGTDVSRVNKNMTVFFIHYPKNISECEPMISSSKETIGKKICTINVDLETSKYQIVD